MAVISDYLKYYKDVSREEYKYNEIDYLLFSLLSYLDINYATSSHTLEECYNEYIKTNNIKDKNKVLFIRRIEDNFSKMSNSIRYKDIIISDFINEVDHLHQFSALTLRYDKTLFISYRGTDETIIGWKDNFESSYKYPTLVQKKSTEYINKVVKHSDKNIILGGHSKGGHLAMNAAMTAKRKIIKKIDKILNYDGPGFLEEQIKSNDFKKIKNKIMNYYPSNSTVGMLMQNPSKYKVVKAAALGFRTHDSNMWNCFGGFFEETKLDKSSKELNIRCNKWLNKYSQNQKEKLVKTLFKILDEAKITVVKDLSPNIDKYIKIINKLKNIDDKEKKLYITMLKELFIKVHDE